MKIFINTIIFAFLVVQTNAQTGVDSLMNEMDKSTKVATENVNNIFKSSRIIMGQSVEMLPAGVLDFRILHRFGTIKNGISDMFGLDYASMRMSFDYGISKDVTIGLGRSTLNKELDFFIKGRLKQQSIGEKAFPVSIAIVGGLTCFTYKTTPAIDFSNRLAYYAQLLIGRKFDDKVSLQLAPTYLHRKLFFFTGDQENVFAFGVGGRVKMSNRIHLLLDAYPALNGVGNTATTPLSVGVDIETGGHVFQLHFSNATGMNEKAFITGTTRKWDKVDVGFGFNLSRVFTIKKNTKTNW
jgi:hypothetical protein